MGVFKRGEMWWYEFSIQGQRIRPYRHIHFATGKFAVAVEVWRRVVMS